MTAASAAYLNNALEPTPAAFARASLRLLARLTAGVRRQQHNGTRATCHNSSCSS
jgi:hypothetical protein